MDSPGIPGWFIAIFVIVVLVAIGSAIARAMYRSSRGVDPFFAKEQVEAAIINSELLRPRDEHLHDQYPDDDHPHDEHPHDTGSPHKSIEQRLAELEDLHGRA